MQLTGRCNCGQVTYRVDGDPVYAGFCCCRDCQRATGSDRAALMGFQRSDVQIDGTLNSYSMTGKSGKQAVRHFCPGCGSLILGLPEIMPEVCSIFAGTLDDPAVFEPQFIMFSSEIWSACEDLKDTPRFAQHPQ